ncbi:MAG TPA: GAF domain-containing protein [Candidatus Limnocylindrales bacterium]|nr:GAF domain-containing protein [Candidatus Limnocylindrales bacterium]
MRLAFLDLPDDRVDLISTARRAPGVDLVLVASADPEALALRIAEVLQIPRSTEPLDLLSLKPDRVALPSLESPGAAALLRSGISPAIFVSLSDLLPLVSVTEPEPVAVEMAPIEEWEREFDEAAGAGRRLGEIREALALSDDRQRLFREVLALAIAETGADAGSLMIVDEDEGELRIAFADGLSRDTVRSVRQKIGEGIAGTVAQNGKPLIVNERVFDPRYKDGRERPRIASAMSSPILLDGRVIGVLNVSSDRQGKRFKDEDLDRLTEIGTQISAILDRVVRRSRSDLEALEFRARESVDRVFRTESGSRTERLRVAATRLAGRLNAQAVTLYSAEKESRDFVVLPSGSGAGETGTVPVHPGSFIARVHREGESVCLTGEAWRTGDDTSRRPALLFLAPIRGKQAHGVLAAEFAGSGDFDPEALAHVLDHVAAHLATLLEASRGDEAASSRRGNLVSLLSDIAPRLMVTRETEGLALETIAALRALFPSGLAAVRLVGRAGDVVLRTAFEGTEEERDAAQDREASLASKAIAEGVELSSATMDATDHRGRPVGPDEGDAAVVPVRTSDRVAGTLGVVLPVRGARGSAIGEHELDALRKLALYVSIAWEHVRGLGGEERETHDRLTGLLTGAGLEARIQEEVKRAERYHEGFLLTLCSINDFMRVAERHGDEFSERLLREFGLALTRNVREVDAVARVGEGRFAVLSPETDKDSGALLKRMDQLLSRVECVQTLDSPSEIRLTGRQYAYPDEIPTGGELIALIRGD